MPRTKKDSVGIIGLGIMGGAFAQNLIAAGWQVIGYDIAPTRRRAMAKLGVDIAEDIEDLARRVRTVITSLPKPAALVETATAIAKAGLPRRVIVEMSTFALDDKIKAEAVLRKAGHVMLDCPVS
ncbi:MAG: NAD(P)-binding domain-containing protein, partial [Rhizobiales bacterium]|nr:NAD(P)-binding domain-containing protein [Hyphomicrobiales bacterium]